MLPEELLTAVAADCPAYESILAAQGFGISFVNTSPIAARCDNCLYWAAGNCAIYRTEAGV